MTRDRIARVYEFWYQIGFCVSFVSVYQGDLVSGIAIFLISLAAFLAYEAIFADIGKG